jgi:predicted ATPase/DNA-binding winged helix-turn-helix (wHTH) protein
MPDGRSRRFAGFELDAWGRLHRDGRPVRIQPQPVRVLTILVESAGQIVPRDQLQACVWDRGTFVEFDQGLNYCLRRIRLALGDDATNPRFVQTVKGQGYRFIAPVEILPDAPPQERKTRASDRSTGWPTIPDRLIGRDHDVARIDSLLRDNRIVTLTGPGGVGKTRLALEIGLRRRVTAGVNAYWIDLTRATHADDVVVLCAEAVGLADTGKGSLLGRLQDWLGLRNALLIFDNFERMLAAAPLLLDLSAPNGAASMLATSRISLSLRGEHEYRVPPLRWTSEPADVHERQPPAVSLFFDRFHAHAGGDAIQPSPGDVAALCERLDGLPLAIELAAARATVMSVPELVARDRIVALLPAAARDVPARQQTLRRTLEWSYDLLGPVERAALRVLATFVGGFTIEAATHALIQTGVAADEAAAMDAVSTLRQHSLVSAAAASSSAIRLRMLETIREFCLEVAPADERAAAQDAHAVWVRLLFERESPQLRTGRDVLSMERLFDDEPNLRAALRWAAEARTADLLGLATAAFWFWYTANLFGELRRWMFTATAEARGRDDVSAQARCVSSALCALAAYHMGAFEDTARLVAEVVAVPVDPFAATVAECLRGALLAHEGRLAEAESVIGGGRERAHALADPWLEGLAAVVGAHCAALGADHAAAFERSREAPRSIGFLDVWLDLTCGLEAVMLERLDEASNRFRRFLSQRYGAYRPIRQLAGAFEGLGYIADRRGATVQAALLLATADRWRRQTVPLFKVWIREHERALASVRAALGERFEHVWTQGQSLSLDEALALAADVAGRDS